MSLMTQLAALKGMPAPTGTSTLQPSMGINPNGGYAPAVQPDRTVVQQFGAPMPQQAAPPTGLVGREQALQGGLEGALKLLGFGSGGASFGNFSSGSGGMQPDYTQIMQNRNLALNQMREGVGELNPWAETGMQANRAQAALSGALGPEAQRAAYAQFQESPGQAFLREQGERSLLRNSAALGGLGGGNVMKELTRFGTGLAAQDFDNYFNRIGGVADRGMQAVGLRSGLRGQGMGAATSAGAQAAGLQGTGLSADASRYASDASRYAARLGADTARARDAAQIASQLGVLTATGRTDAGNQIAGGFNTYGQNLANLASQQGSGLSDIYGTGMSNLAQLFTGAGRDAGASAQALAQLLGGTRMQGSGQYAGTTSLLPTQQTGGALEGIGNLLGGAGSLMTGLRTPQPV